MRTVLLTQPVVALLLIRLACEITDSELLFLALCYYTGYICTKANVWCVFGFARYCNNRRRIPEASTDIPNPSFAVVSPAVALAAAATFYTAAALGAVAAPAASAGERVSSKQPGQAIALLEANMTNLELSPGSSRDCFQRVQCCLLFCWQPFL